MELLDIDNLSDDDLAEITMRLKSYLGNKEIIQKRWSEVDTENEIKKIIRRLQTQERKLLPWKKKRALVVGENILRQLLESLPKKENEKRTRIMQLLTLYNPDPETDEFVDYDHFAELWLTFLVPALDNVRKKQN